MPDSDLVAVARQELDQRKAARVASRAALETLDARIGAVRGALAIGVAIAVYLWLGPRTLPSTVSAGLGIAFLFAVIVHGRVLWRQARADRAIAYYQRALDRLDETWQARGAKDADGARFIVAAHPYARDLDLFGPGSLYQLLSTARTQAGEATLAAFLAKPATPAIVSERQAAVRELATALDLHEALALASDEVKDDLNLDALRAWAAQPPAPIGLAWALVWGLAGAAALTTFVTWQIGRTAYWPFGVAVLVVIALFRLSKPAVDRATAAVWTAERQLALLAALFEILEAAPVQAPRLLALRRMLGDGGERASAAIAKLRRLVAAYAWQKNQLIAPFAAMILWGPQMSRLIERWRITHGAAISGWLDALGEWEALVSIAAYAHAHPAGAGHAWPEIVNGGEPVFEATALGHPLIARNKCVHNDLSIGLSAPHLYVVSGSNMSGKSTLLRSVGINVVMALAGAPVRAARLRLTPLQVGASIRVEDSLGDGVSRFYAEVKRLALLDELAGGALPLLFVIDEALAGTNSHDRRIGAAAVAKNLLAQHAIGLLTTHDLALAEIVTALPSATNVHFQDGDGEANTSIGSDGKMRFDYRLRPGPIDPARSNALALMRAAGLRV